MDLIVILTYLSGRNLTALIPHWFLSNILKHGYFIRMSQILTEASFDPEARMLPSRLNTSRL